MENYRYVPHVTLSMDTPGRTEECFDLARRRWAEFGGPVRLEVSVLTLVQQLANDTWTDLEELRLTAQTPIGVRV